MNAPEPRSRCWRRSPTAARCSAPIARARWRSRARASEELDTDEWRRVLAEAAALGVLQVHFSGGEPTARRDLEELVAAARAGSTAT